MTTDELRQRAALALLPAIWTEWSRVEETLPFVDFLDDVWKMSAAQESQLFLHRRAHAAAMCVRGCGTTQNTTKRPQNSQKQRTPFFGCLMADLMTKLIGCGMKRQRRLTPNSEIDSEHTA